MCSSKPHSHVSEVHPHSLSLSLYLICCLSLAENVLSCSNTNITVPSPKRNKVVGDLHHALHHDLHSFLTRDSQSAVGQLSKKAPFPPKRNKLWRTYGVKTCSHCSLAQSLSLFLLYQPLSQETEPQSSSVSESQREGKRGNDKGSGNSV